MRNNTFNAQRWAKSVLELQQLKTTHSLNNKDVVWLLDNLRYPFIDHPVAQYLIREYHAEDN